jgi:hypothetical protein
LFETTETSWQLRIARGSGAFETVPALKGAPEARRVYSVLFVGDLGDKELWLSLFDESGMPALDYVTLRLIGGTDVKRVPHKWYLDILPSGEVHAMAVRGLDPTRAPTLLGWVAPPGGAPYTVTLPDVGGEQPKILHGAPRFTAVVEARGLWIRERDDHSVFTRTSEPFTSEAAGPNDEVWYAEDKKGSGPVLRRGALGASDGPMTGEAIPLPNQKELGAQGASDDGCELGFVDAIVPLPDGSVWLDVNARKGARTILRRSTH